MCLVMPHLHWKLLSKIAPNTSSRVCFPNIPKHADLALRKNGWVKMVFQEEDTSPPLASRLIQTELGRKTKFADSKPTICCFRQENTQSERVLPPPVEASWLRKSCWKGWGLGRRGAHLRPPGQNSQWQRLCTCCSSHPCVCTQKSCLHSRKSKKKAIPKVHS